MFKQVCLWFRKTSLYERFSFYTFKENSQMSFLPVYFYFILLCLLISLFVYKHQRFIYLKMFTVFFIATLFAEFTGSYRAYIGKNNLFIYNFFSVVEFLFYLYFISIVIRNNTAKKILQISMPLYALIAVANILFVQGMKKLHTITYSFGCLMIVTACIYYFFELFRNPKSVKLKEQVTKCPNSSRKLVQQKENL